MRARDMRPVALGSHITPFSFIFRRYHFTPKRLRNGPAQRQPARLRRGAVSMRRTLGLRVRRRPGGAPPESLVPAAIRPSGAGLFRGAPKYSRGTTPPLATSVRAAARRLASPVLQLRALCCCGGARAEASPPRRRAPPRPPPLSSPGRVRRTEPEARGPLTTIEKSGETKEGPCGVRYLVSISLHRLSIWHREYGFRATHFQINDISKTLSPRISRFAAPLGSFKRVSTQAPSLFRWEIRCVGKKYLT